jgi:hypothetical protein
VDPALQIHALSNVLPEGDVDKGGHAVQMLEPAFILYLPASHAVQVPPSLPVYPALQVQSSIASLRDGEVESAGQSVHTVESIEYFPATQSIQTVDEFAAGSVEYFPASQSLHSLLPSFPLYLPATHAVQVPPSLPVYPALQVQLPGPTAPRDEDDPVGQSWHCVIFL